MRFLVVIINLYLGNRKPCFLEKSYKSQIRQIYLSPILLGHLKRFLYDFRYAGGYVYCRI